MVLAVMTAGTGTRAEEAAATDEAMGEAAATPVTAVASSNPMSGDPEAIAAGQKLFFKWCVACHGKNADGVSRFGDYAADLRNFWRGYSEFVGIVLFGRPKKMMPPWNGVLDGDQISQIGAFLETLASEKAVWTD
jgi:mono/diheme cytochrome c family protein